MRESAYQKSRRYLLEGRVVLTQVTPQRVDAFVRGDGTVYTSSYHGGTWTCSCPSRTVECCHLRAVRLVTAPDLPPPPHPPTPKGKPR